MKAHEIEDVHKAEAIVREIRPILAGKNPDIINAALCDLFATFLASHHPTLRDELLNSMIMCITELIPLNEEEIFRDKPRPDGWDDK